MPAVALIGPRQAGKTTLAHAIAETVPSIYLDLQASEDRARLAEPALFLNAHEDRLVILDEIHRVPELLPVLRGIIDRGRRKGKKTGRFLILGSASIDLLRQSGESLAGRLAYVEMGPLMATELRNQGGGDLDLIPLWVRGGFPESYLAGGDDASFAWRRDFIRAYLERDIPQLGPRIPSETLARLWTMLAHEQGGLLNASRLATSLMVAAPTLTRYVDLLVDLLLVRRLCPFHSNAGKRLVKSPKVYVRDSGLVHALLGVRDYDALSGHPVVGTSWEGFVIENLIAAAPPGTTVGFYRTSVGAEVDLLLEIPGQGTWAFDIKRGIATKPQKGFYAACDDLNPEHRFFVNSGNARYPLTNNTEAIGLMEITSLLSAL